MDTYGFADGDRVRDTRDGSLGTVRIPEDGGVGEVVWDTSFVQDELAVAAPYLERT